MRWVLQAFRHDTIPRARLDSRRACGQVRDAHSRGDHLNQSGQARGLNVCRFNFRQSTCGNGLIAQTVTLFKKEDPHVAQLFVVDRATRFRQGMTLGHREKKRIVSERHLDEAGERRRECKQPEIDRAFGKCCDQFVGAHFVEVKFDVGMSAGQGSHDPRKHVRREGGYDAQADGTVESVGVEPRNGDEVVDVGKDASGACHNFFPFGGESRAGGHALNECGAETTFEFPDLCAEGRLRHVRGIGCTTEVAVVGEGDEIGELLQGGRCDKATLSVNPRGFDPDHTG
jgi:hypothetical protein